MVPCQSSYRVHFQLKVTKNQRLEHNSLWNKRLELQVNEPDIRFPAHASSIMFFQLTILLLRNGIVELSFNRFLQTKTVFTFVLAFACSIKMFNNFEILIQGLSQRGRFDSSLSSQCWEKLENQILAPDLISSQKGDVSESRKELVSSKLYRQFSFRSKKLHSEIFFELFPVSSLLATEANPSPPPPKKKKFKTCFKERCILSPIITGWIENNQFVSHRGQF